MFSIFQKFLSLLSDNKIDSYVVKPERARGETETFWYGHKNGWYVSGTTSKTRDESVRLICEIFGIEKGDVK